MVIGIDLDSTLVKLNTVTRASMELGYGFDDTHVEDWHQTNFPEDLRKRIFELFMCDRHMNHLVMPIDGAQEKLNEWKAAGHEIHVVTARVNQIRKNTISMVEKFFPRVSSVRFVDMHSTKIPILRELNADVWIDDAPHGVQESTASKINTFLISNKYTKYNWHVRDLPGITVVKSVGEIIL